MAENALINAEIISIKDAIDDTERKLIFKFKETKSAVIFKTVAMVIQEKYTANTVFIIKFLL